MTRQNPASLFIARQLAQDATGKPWNKLSHGKRVKWLHLASNLVVALYDAGFTIPQPADPDAIWDSLRSSS